jgi:6-phosphogluconolactonase
VLINMMVRIATEGREFAAEAADTVSSWLAEAGAPANLALAGGSTPAPMYRELRTRDVDWKNVVLWVGDERWVPPDHKDNNSRMARDALADHVPATFLPVPYDPTSPDKAAADYEAQLRDALPERNGRLSPDVVLLGIGDDGHTLSLFPETAALEETERLYVAHRVPKLDEWRLTATFPLIHEARHILFLVSGEGKAAAVARILEQTDATDPAKRVLDGDAEVVWLLDEGAASNLKRTPV